MFISRANVINLLIDMVFITRMSFLVAQRASRFFGKLSILEVF
ncbi:hypothetical protein BSPCLSOX_876 [uncultured Gammaproteobacteria bacterium]|nr:hypothetical protein BSPCLSOX_876 [uncultured Gammaproteobacteria bacterium]